MRPRACVQHSCRGSLVRCIQPRNGHTANGTLPTTIVRLGLTPAKVWRRWLALHRNSARVGPFVAQQRLSKPVRLRRSMPADSVRSGQHAGALVPARRILLATVLLATRADVGRAGLAEHSALLTLQRQWLQLQPGGTFAAATAVGWPENSTALEACAYAWRGVTCSCGAGARPCAAGEAPHVTALALPAAATPGATLYGSLADVLGSLPHLETLDLSNQRLSGPLPASLFTHPALVSARLNGNMFSGPLLPPGVLELAAPLATLDVRFNMLSGSVPAALCDAQSLAVDGNAMLCGPLPPCYRRRAGVTAAHTGVPTSRCSPSRRARSYGTALSASSMVRCYMAHTPVSRGTQASGACRQRFAPAAWPPQPAPSSRSHCPKARTAEAASWPSAQQLWRACP